MLEEYFILNKAKNGNVVDQDLIGLLEGGRLEGIEFRKGEQWLNTGTGGD